MSVARGFPNAGHFYSNLVKPIEIDLQFTVDPANENGLGVSSLKSNGYVESVFMHTLVTPGSVNGHTNPNPADGYAMITFKQNFNAFISVDSLIMGVSGGDLTSVTNHSVYVITSVGTTSLAQWQAAGLTPGFTPAVGQAFVAIKTGALGGTGTVQAAARSGVNTVEVLGNPSVQANNSQISQNAGAVMLVQFIGPTDADTTTPIAVSPASGSVVCLRVLMDGSSVTVDGL